jgi:hypothetical protein
VLILAHLLYPCGNRLTVAEREQHFRSAPLNDLLQYKRRQVIEQVCVIDTRSHGDARRRGGQ